MLEPMMDPLSGDRTTAFDHRVVRPLLWTSQFPIERPSARFVPSP
jgi:hypothetical protein